MTPKTIVVYGLPGPQASSVACALLGKFSGRVPSLRNILIFDVVTLRRHDSCHDKCFKSKLLVFGSKSNLEKKYCCRNDNMLVT